MSGGVGGGGERGNALDGQIGDSGQDVAKYGRTGTFSLRQLSMTERMAATRGPACGLPIWIQFLRPIATGRMEFSARLLLSSSSG